MNAEVSVDVLVIGGGPGGTPAALALAGAGQRVLLAESGPGLGGTCLFEGCIPSKIFRETAARRRDLAGAREFGLILPDAATAAIDWATVQARRHRILSARAQAALARARTLPQLDVLFGRARLTGPRTALVELPDASRRVQFGRAILSTGSVPNRLTIPGADHPGVLDSARLIGIGFVPDSLVLIGGGPIGVEMAQIFAMLGSQVTVLEASDRILQPVDSVLAERLRHRLAVDGIAIEVGVRVVSIDGGANRHRVAYTTAAGQEREIGADVVAIVAGRHPAVAGLGLETTAVEYDRHGVKVDATLQTGEEGIYATGDLVGHPMFAHWATSQALALAAHLLGKPATFPRPEHNSAVIFSSPELGMAGLTEEGARAAGLDVGVAEYDYAGDARAQIAGDAEGLLRLVYRREDMGIVGVHALVSGASDLMGEAALAIRAGVTLPHLAQAIHPHPTLTEAFGLAARAALGNR